MPASVVVLLGVSVVVDDCTSVVVDDCTSVVVDDCTSVVVAIDDCTTDREVYQTDEHCVVKNIMSCQYAAHNYIPSIIIILNLY